MTDNKTIWDELVKTDYQLESIEITIGSKILEICIIFNNLNDLDNFTNYIFTKYYYSINNVNISDYSFSLNLFYTTIDTFEMLDYPSNVSIIKIYNNVCVKTLPETQIYSIKLLNLPPNLSQLKIISHNPFNLSNLPQQLILLDLAESPCKFNLDYLPNSIQILYLHNIYEIIQMKIYKLEDLSNLPSGLVEINFGNYKKYNSTDELMKKFNKDFIF